MGFVTSQFLLYTGAMSDLSKQQLILLALLVSFVTSLATGIITVSLMDQAPQGVIQTITQVVDKTIQEAAAPAQDSTADASSAASPGDALADAVAGVTQSIVELARSRFQRGLRARPGSLRQGSHPGRQVFHGGSHRLHGGPFRRHGSACFHSSVADQRRHRIPGFDGDAAVPWLGHHYHIRADILRRRPPARAGRLLADRHFDARPRAGDRDSLPSRRQLLRPIVARRRFTTSIPAGSVMLGSPLFTADGSVIGVHTVSVPQSSGTAFYSTSGLGAVVPVIQ